MPTSPPSINDYVRRVLDGDLDAYREIVLQFENDIFRLVAPVIADRHAVEEIVQDVFITACSVLESFDTKLPFRPWLTGVARNVLRNELRRRGREAARWKVYCQYLESDRRVSATGCQKEELVTVLAKCRESLAGPAAEAVRLRYDEECSVAQVAARIDRSESAAQQLLYRARILLRDCVQQNLPLADGGEA